MTNSKTAQAPAFLVPTVLVVDADPETRLMYRALFEPLVGSVVEAEDGAEALGKAMCERPGLVITETKLPRVDGYALCSFLQKEPATRGAKIMVVTGAASAEDRARAADAGAAAVLTKPCDIDEVIDTARRLCAPRTDDPSPVASTSVATPTAARPRRNIKSRAYERRFTTKPPSDPPELFCPTCTTPLAYVNSHLGGVSATYAEQWDYYSCARCGTYRYRHRTRRLTRTSDRPAAAHSTS